MQDKIYVRQGRSLLYLMITLPFMQQIIDQNDID